MPSLESQLLEQSKHFLLFQPLYDSAHDLCPVARANQECVRGIDDDQIFHANGRDKFSGARDEIPIRIYGVPFAGENILTRLLRKQFVYGGPRSDIAPSNFRGDYKDLRNAR